MEFIKIGPKDILDILIVWLLFYVVLRLFRGTRAIIIMAGITFVILIALFAQFANLEALNSIISGFQTLGLLALIVIFQPEIRRMLASIGQNPLVRRFWKTSPPYKFGEIAQAAFKLRDKGLGAIIVIERNIGLRDYVSDSGVELDAEVSAPLIVSIFTKASPLHDGALVIKGSKIIAARVILPLASSKLPKEFGTRHRAAVGIVEQTDAISIVVSEEQQVVRVIATPDTIVKVSSQKELEQILFTLLIEESSTSYVIESKAG